MTPQFLITGINTSSFLLPVICLILGKKCNATQHCHSEKMVMLLADTCVLAGGQLHRVMAQNVHLSA